MSFSNLGRLKSKDAKVGLDQNASTYPVKSIFGSLGHFFFSEILAFTSQSCLLKEQQVGVKSSLICIFVYIILCSV
jgi:hypothetical protein